jgi:hypothetical protein
VLAASGNGSATTSVSGKTPAPAAPSPPAPPVRQRSAPLIDIVCGECGGNNVCRDAWAVWDLDEQDWVLGAVFDDGHCDDCGGEARLEEVELPPQPSRTG